MTWATITFAGSAAAEWFSHEIAESFAGVLTTNYIADPQCGPVGFVTASVDGRGWSDTMWFRDTGVFLRELTQYGAWDEAKAVVRAAFAHVAPNDEGYLTFPEYVHMDERRSGTELDGTATLLIGMALLYEHLPTDDPFRAQIAALLKGTNSPVRYLLRVLDHAPFVAGSGEFGGGCGIPGDYDNVVQNALVAWALAAVARVLGQDAPEIALLAAACQDASRALQGRLVQHFVSEAGTWHWCLDPATHAPAAINGEEINRGFGGINGAFTSASEVYGVLPLVGQAGWVAPSVQTFLALLSWPQRMAQFADCGIWTQFNDAPMDGTLRLLTSPSYGQGYALQTMLLLDRPELYTKAANWLAWATTEPGYTPTRTSRYHFLERYYAPERYSEPDLEEGCGALNLVNVSEPLKVARLMVGLDDTDPAHIRLVPRLPVGWTQAQARNLPVRLAQGSGHLLLDVTIAADEAGTITHVSGAAADGAASLPTLHVRLGTATQPHWVTTEANAAHFQITYDGSLAS